MHSVILHCLPSCATRLAPTSRICCPAARRAQAAVTLHYAQRPIPASLPAPRCPTAPRLCCLALYMTLQAGGTAPAPPAPVSAHSARTALRPPLPARPGSSIDSLTRACAAPRHAWHSLLTPGAMPVQARRPPLPGWQSQVLAPGLPGWGARAVHSQGTPVPPPLEAPTPRHPRLTFSLHDCRRLLSPPRGLAGLWITRYSRGAVEPPPPPPACPIFYFLAHNLSAS
jgi:hypothetical protein